MARTKLSRDLYCELRKLSIPTVKTKGTILFRAGQPVKGAFLVRSGQVKMTLDHSPLYPTRSLGAGTIIGLPATFSGEPYSLTAKAERDCHLDFIPRARLLELLRLNPKLGFQIVRMLSEEIFQMRKGARTKPLHRLQIPDAKADCR
jgi:CRP-like cAMP-binding protein